MHVYIHTYLVIQKTKDDLGLIHWSHQPFSLSWLHYYPSHQNHGDGCWFLQVYSPAQIILSLQNHISKCIRSSQCGVLQKSLGCSVHHLDVRSCWLGMTGAQQHLKGILLATHDEHDCAEEFGRVVCTKVP